MYNDASSGILFVMLIIWFYLEKNLENKGFTSLTQIFKLLVWVPKNFETYSDVIDNCMPSV